ncbi:MAG: sigma-70 family RNA polymerase sigma factor, partial [Clostridia bacterium]|nr:sigma-70 family RNA polymerase sigma factor [Clostridia bacterium]
MISLKQIKKYIQNLLSGKFLLEENKLTDDIILFLCSGDALPSPLDSETELEYIEKAELGDEEAKNKLIEHNLRLVVYISKKFVNTNIELEDLISVGSIGLIKAVNSFKLEKNIKLATYASRCIENEILMHLRKTSKLKVEVSLDEPLTVDGDGNEIVLGDILSMETDSV